MPCRRTQTSKQYPNTSLQLTPVVTGEDQGGLDPWRSRPPQRNGPKRLGLIYFFVNVWCCKSWRANPKGLLNLQSSWCWKFWNANQKATPAYFSSKQVLPFDFADQFCWGMCSHVTSPHTKSLKWQVCPFNPQGIIYTRTCLKNKKNMRWILSVEACGVCEPRAQNYFQSNYQLLEPFHL